MTRAVMITSQSLTRYWNQEQTRAGMDVIWGNKLIVPTTLNSFFLSNMQEQTCRSKREKWVVQIHKKQISSWTLNSNKPSIELELMSNRDKLDLCSYTPISTPNNSEMRTETFAFSFSFSFSSFSLAFFNFFNSFARAFFLASFSAYSTYTHKFVSKENKHTHNVLFIHLMNCS